MNLAIDPRLIARLSTEFTSLSEHLNVLGRDLETLRCQVVAENARTAQQPTPPPAPVATPEATGATMPTVPSGGAPTAWNPFPAAQTAGTGQNPPPAPAPVPPVPTAAAQPQATGGPWQAQPVAPVGGWRQPTYQPTPRLPQQRNRAYARPIRTPWWQREGIISRVLAVAGVAVTLIGVVMLLVLAAQAGFFGPVPRVVAGALFSGALVAIATRVAAKAGGKVGGIALAATGIAGGYLDVVAVTSIYHWLNPVVGFVVALGIAAGGVALAMRWGSQALAVLVVLGAALLAPFVSTELVVLLGFLIVLQIAALPVQSVRDWPVLHLVRTLPAALTTLLAVAATALTGDDTSVLRIELLAAASVIAVAGLAGAVLAGRQRAGDVTASLSFAAATLPLLAAPVMFDRTGSILVSASFAAVLLVTAALPWIPKLGGALRIPGHLAVVSGLAGAFALLEACLGISRVQTLPVALSVVAMGFLAVAGQQRSRVAGALGAAYGVLAGMTFCYRADPGTLAGRTEAEAHLGISTALSALMILAVPAVAGWCARRLGLLDRESNATVLSVFAGLVGLYAVTTLTVSLGVATGNPDGFRAGHGIATVVWMATATGALLYGLRSLSRTPQRAKVALAAGLLVTAAALAKLFLFDLATLDGLLRAGAFLVVGVLLLLVGTRYARAFADMDTRTPTA
ncbi:DUF2339 domain-containing protein [Nocardia sp. CDC153]|uniref:DUF2339 domain-containing protein n=1 Tax=Nocardia sp. CDC153 TaxID=3112167 RepID=UPI002DBB84AB|nr:DUF2339 domain-containing protein [Nocardia sp. CDC153]MEC3958254.1 DUF2339 domain-containing protein [Nocardia sp. CDC153]